MNNVIVNILSALLMLGAVALAVSIDAPRERWQQHEARR